MFLRGERFSVFLKEAYEGPKLIDKQPLVVWKEKVLSHVGLRGNKKKIESFEHFSEMEEKGLVGSDYEGDGIGMQLKDWETVQCLEMSSGADCSEMEIGEI